MIVLTVLRVRYHTPHTATQNTHTKKKEEKKQVKEKKWRVISMKFLRSFPRHQSFHQTQTRKTFSYSVQLKILNVDKMASK